MTLTIGSFCSGYGGLDMAAALVLGGTVAWHADNDPAASAVLARRWPGVPNHGDLTDVDWSTVEPVDVVTAGFPCQDLSYAGRGAGIRKGTRSGLWYAIADALGVLRPRIVILENVPAVVTRRPGLDVVLGCLAELGFDADWTCVSASDVGAPHRRNRWFCVAAPGGDADSVDRGRRPAAGLAGETGPAVGLPADPEGAGLEGGRQGRPARSATADAEGNGWGEGRAQSAWVVGGPDAAERGHVAADTAVHYEPVQPAGDGRRRPVGRAEPGAGDRDLAGDPAARVRDLGGSAGQEWGVYGPAIARWAAVLGRPAPEPTQPSRTGRPQLAPAFVEWLMGLPAGHVTDTPGLSRSQQLHVLGNGVVPQQAAAALTTLLGVTLERVA